MVSVFYTSRPAVIGQSAGSLLIVFVI